MPLSGHQIIVEYRHGTTLDFPLKFKKNLKKDHILNQKHLKCLKTFQKPSLSATEIKIKTEYSKQLSQHYIYPLHIDD